MMEEGLPPIPLGVSSTEMAAYMLEHGEKMMKIKRKFLKKEHLDPNTFEERRCTLASCTKIATKKCSRCRAVYYCSMECNAANWKVHKTGCKKVEKVKGKATKENADVGNIKPKNKKTYKNENMESSRNENQGKSTIKNAASKANVKKGIKQPISKQAGNLEVSLGMKAEGAGQEMKEDVGKFYRWVPCIWEELTVGGPGAWKLHLESDYEPLLLQPGATGHGETLGLINYHMVTIKEVKEELNPETKPKNYFKAKISIEAEVLNDCTNVKEDIAADIYLVNGKVDEGVIRVEILVRIYQQEQTHQVVYFASKEQAVAEDRVKELVWDLNDSD